MANIIQASVGCKGDWSGNDGCCGICAVDYSQHWSSLNPTQDQINAAKAAIGHRCDGPITSFVLIARATEYAGNHRTLHRAAAEALAELLEEYGYVTSDVNYQTGS